MIRCKCFLFILCLLLTSCPQDPNKGKGTFAETRDDNGHLEKIEYFNNGTLYKTEYYEYLNKHDEENRLVKTVENGQTTYEMEENNYIVKEVINAPRSYKDTLNDVILTPYNLIADRTEQSYPYTLLDDFPQYRTFYMDVDSTLEITLDSNFQMEQVYATPGNSDARNVFGEISSDIDINGYKSTITIITKWKQDKKYEIKEDSLSDEAIINIDVNNGLKILLKVVVYDKNNKTS